MAFRIGGIYRTRGGEFRELRENPHCPTQAIAVHINPHTGRRGEEGSTRELATGLFPHRRLDHEHRAHLELGEWAFVDGAMRAIIAGGTWEPGEVVDAEVKAVDPVHADEANPRHCGRHGIIFDGNVHASCPTCDAPAATLATSTDPRDIAMLQRDDILGESLKAHSQQQQKAPPLAKPVKPTPRGLGLSPDLAPASHLVAPAHGSAALSK